jgi:hypothetical protein
MAVMWFPIFLWLSGIVCTVLQLFLQVKNIHEPSFGPYEWAKVIMHVGPGIAIIPFLASTILLNVYCTGEFSKATRLVFGSATHAFSGQAS